MILKLLPLCLLVVSCASQPPKLQVELMSESEYLDLVETNTKRSQVYEGFYNTLELNATLLNSKVTQGQVDQSARLYQWEQSTYDTEKAKMLDQLKKNTRIFLSFFTPERKHDDLAKSKSLWKIFLDVQGHRYEAKVTKEKKLVAELKSYYPFHTRWNSAYLLEFAVPQEQIESTPIKLTLTGPVGSTSVEF